MTAAPARKYNPGFLSDDELIASFCVRTHEFESLIEALRGCTGDSNQHQIVIGPRGSGKTSLLLRAAAEVRRDADLAAGFFPIVFAEESYEVGTAGEFWLECLARLAIQAPQREDAPDLHATLADLRTIHDDRTLGERCLATLLDFADREGKRLVLMVENLNMMFRDMMDRDAGWRLRKVLQTEPRIILLASATSRFGEIDHPDHALYDLFRVLTLRPLTTAECTALWESVTGQSRPANTIRSLEILTGGSPRLLAIVARFGAGLSFRELMHSLFDLVDDHTEYFKSHLESLPPQERRVYLALAELWKPALTKEIAERARIETSKCSAQLKRLMARGVVRLDGGSARRKQYYLSERMYNIYYLLRRGRERLVEVLIRFMASYYSPVELAEIGDRMSREKGDVEPERRHLYRSAYQRLLALTATSMELANDLIRKGVDLWDRGHPADALDTFDQVVRRFGDSKEPELRVAVAMALVNKGSTLGALNRLKEALVACDEVLRRFGDSNVPELIEPVARALVNKGAALFGLSRLEETLVTCDEVLRRFGASAAPELLDNVAGALINRGIALSALNRPEEALTACDEVLRRFGDSDAAELAESVAKALVSKSVMLGPTARPHEVLAVCDEVLRRFGDSNSPTLVENVANSLAVKGIALSTLDRPEDALVACDEALRRYGRSNAVEILTRAAGVVVTRSIALTMLSRPPHPRDVAALLAVLPRLESPKVAIGALLRFSIALGPKRMNDLIQASPSAELLRPLTTALDREMGLDPRVPEEVSEVAKDIRQNLAKMREAPR